MPTSPASGSAVLVVDDDHLCQQLMLAFLQRLGHRPTLAGSAREALEHAAEEAFDSVILDLEMPAMQGTELLHALRGQDRALGRGRVPALVVSGHTDGAVRQRCLREGFDGYLSKPILLPALKSELERVLAAETEAADAAVCDFATVMQGMGIDHDVLKLLLRSFLHYCPDDEQALREALTRSDYAAVRLYAHKLKGSLGTLMAGPSVDSAARLEAAAASADAAACAREGERFVRRLERFRLDARRWLDREAG